MGKRILLVDDEEDLRKFVGIRLEANGYKVTTAVNGAEALKKLEASRPDLIVTDVIMPVMDGVDFYMELKKTPRMKDIPVIILTAKGQMEENFRKVKVDEFVAKPLDHEDFLAKVKGCLERSKFRRSILVGGSGKEALENIESGIKAKYEVHTAWGSKAFLEMAKAVNPDEIVIDVMMENKPSSAVIAAVRKNPSLKETPVVVFSDLDKDNLPVGQSLNQKKLEIESAKSACLDAGAEKFLGETNEDSLQTNLAEYF